MNEMIMRVARMFDQEAWIAVDGNRADTGMNLWDKRCAHSIFKAQQAMQTMREPTAKMIEAAITADPLSCDVPDEDRIMIYTRIWQGMIDAELLA